ncbi:MAG: helix-turn-helix domain-containing protein [Pseudonocardiales bacterium]
MNTVHRWTGRETKLLREALRLSVRDFADRLGVGVRTVNKWEARQLDITPLPYMQEVLDTALARASDEVKARFAAATRADVPEHGTAQLSGPPVRAAMLPVVVNGRLVLVPFNADALVASGLGALIDELASAGTAGGSAPAVSDRVQKRSITPASSDLWQTVTAITHGEGQTELDLDRLDRLIPRLDADEPPRQVGSADVDAIERTSDALRRCDLAHGGGLARAATIAQLRSFLRLREAAATLAIRVRLDIAAADLAAWCSYDVEQHDQARRLWIVALELCRHTAHPRAADLAVDILLDMAHQSLHLRRPNEALRLVGLGLVVENNSPAAVSDSTRSYLSSVQSWSYAVLGETTALEEITRTSSRRAYQRLRMLDDCLAVHQTADVVELRHDIRTACAVS